MSTDHTSNVYCLISYQRTSDAVRPASWLSNKIYFYNVKLFDQDMTLVMFDEASSKMDLQNFEHDFFLITIAA